MNGARSAEPAAGQSSCRGAGLRRRVETPRLLDDVRAFRETPLPPGPGEFRLAAQIVRGLGYGGVAIALVLVALLATGGTLLPRVLEPLARQSPLVLGILAAGGVVTSLLVVFSYPAFVAGERWSLFVLALVGVGFVLLVPLRFFAEAAILGDHTPAIPPTSGEWIILGASGAFLYVLLSPETREGMRTMRLQHGPTPVADGVRYVCPQCGRVYRLRKEPSIGTLCARCRGT